MWYSWVDCGPCKEAFEEGLTPCTSCQPWVHPYNVDVLHLYRACSDQVLSGPSGAIGLNDIAINVAMDNYFKVEKRHKLALSSSVRQLFSYILKDQNDKDS